MKLMNKKGQVVQQLQGFVYAIGGMAIILAIVLYVINTTGAEMPNNSYAYNATRDLEAKLGNSTTWIESLSTPLATMG